MKILFVKTFEYWHPTKRYFTKFARMKVYDLPEQYAEWFIADGYAVRFGLMSELGVNQ